MLKFIKVSISALLTIILAPIAFLAATLLTDSGKDMSKVAEFKKDQLVSEKLVTALSEMSKDVNNPKLSFTFNNDEMDSLFNYVYEKNIKSTVACEYIKKFYCDAKDNNRWDFTVVGGWKFFNTKATLPTTISVDNENFVFKFDAPILGRLNTEFAREYIAQLAKSLKINTLLESPLQKLGIDGIKIDIENEGTITIPTAGLMTYATKLQSQTDGIMNALLSVFVGNSKDMISAETNKELGITLNLKDLTESEYDPPKRDVVEKFNTNLTSASNSYVSQVKNWADSETAELKESDITNKLQEFIKTDPLKADKSTVGKDFLENITSTVKNIKLTDIPSKIENGLPLGNISATSLFNFLRGTDVVGKTTTYSKKINGKYVVNQITVEAIDFKFYTENEINKVAVFVTININGVPVSAILDYSVSFDSENKTILMFGDKDIEKNAFYIGNKEIKGNAKKDFVALLQQAGAKTESEVFKVTESGAIAINLFSKMPEESKTITDAIKKIINEDTGEIVVNCSANNGINEDVSGGQIDFTLKKKIKYNLIFICS